jgi:hypothetical protein
MGEKDPRWGKHAASGSHILIIRRCQVIVKELDSDINQGVFSISIQSHKSQSIPSHNTLSLSIRLQFGLLLLLLFRDLSAPSHLNTLPPSKMRHRAPHTSNTVQPQRPRTCISRQNPRRQPKDGDIRIKRPRRIGTPHSRGRSSRRWSLPLCRKYPMQRHSCKKLQARS